MYEHLWCTRVQPKAASLQQSEPASAAPRLASAESAGPSFATSNLLRYIPEKVSRDTQKKDRRLHIRVKILWRCRLRSLGAVASRQAQSVHGAPGQWGSRTRTGYVFKLTRSTVTFVGCTGR